MIVYLDMLILDNFFADAALLYCAVRTVKGEAKFWRIALTALLGTVLGVGYTVFRLYFSLPTAVDWLLKYGVAIVLPLPAARFKRKRTYALCCLAFVGYMFAFAGLLTALFSRSQVNVGEGALTYTIYGIPSGVLVAACVAFAFVAVRLVRRLSEHGKMLAYVCDCRLTLQGRSVSIRGFVDTGNRLRDVRGQAVAVVERSVVFGLLGENLFLTSTPAERIAVRTVNGKSFFSAMRIDRMEIYCGGLANIIEDVTVAVSPEPLAGEYGIILPPEFAKEENFHKSGG